MNFEEILNRYLSELSELFSESQRTGQMTAELSFRPILDKFFDNITEYVNPGAERVFEPKDQSNAGRPDWKFYNRSNLGVYGYVEGKGTDPSKHIGSTDYQEQIERYIYIGHTVILTDGLDFIFYVPNESPIFISLVDKPLSAEAEWRLSSQAQLLEEQFRSFFADPRARSVSENQLISEAAARAKALAQNVQELADLPDGSGANESENQTIRILRDLKQTVQDHHDPLLNNKDNFSDFIAQVLIFGLVYAHRIVASNEMEPTERYEKIRNFWSGMLNAESSQQLKPFKALVDILGSELDSSSLGPVGTWYDDCCLLLSHVRLSEEQRTDPDYHLLFERFLEVFDPETRFDYGAFYTPFELSRYMVSASEKISSDHCGLSLYDENNKLIDPCCGTGSFLENLVTGADSASSDPSIIGLEILPGPYTLAHYRIAMHKNPIPENINIVLTNTLSDELESSHQNSDESLLTEEKRKAKEFVKPPLTLIIGNPPSSDSAQHSSGSHFEILADLLEDFRPPSGRRTSRQNIQRGLQNEYIKFLRWSANKLSETGTGIMALVLPSSFAENASYKYARKWLFDNFDSFWVMDIDMDARTGARPSNIFNTLQGRMVLLAVRRSGSTSSDNKPLNYCSVTDLRKSEKLSFMIDSIENPLKAYERHEISTQDYAFRPSKKFDSDIYDQFWDLHASNENSMSHIFERHVSGLKLAPSSILVHVSEPVLKRRSMEIGDSNNTVEDIIDRWFAGQTRPPRQSKFTESVRDSIKAAVQDKDAKHICDYSYRPFLSVSALISDAVLSALTETRGGGTRARPELRSAFSERETIGIAVAPSTRDIGTKLHRFASFCWSLPDNDLCKRGNAHIFTNFFPQYERSRASWDPRPRPNINPVLTEKLQLNNMDDMVFYVYAVLCSDSFLEEFEGVLFTFSNPDKLPKIPIVTDSQVFERIANIGRELAELEKLETGEEELDPVYQQYIDLFDENFDLISFDLDPEKGKIILKSDSQETVLEGVPADVILFEVSGYQVIQQWLKMRSYKFKRGEFTRNDFISFLVLLHSISKQIDLVAALDEDMRGIISGDINLLTPSFG